jgi:tyrosine-protein phosphatase non-receptor type 9
MKEVSVTVSNHLSLLQNRYTDVLCYDHTRVVLSRDDNDTDTDYINGNFVDGYVYS